MSAAKKNTENSTPKMPETVEKQTPKMMAEKLLEPTKEKINRNLKDSVFCDLFARPEYLIQLYQTLHPEDTTTTPDDLTIVTLTQLFVKEIYNDLGFLAGNRLIVLVEHQSKWSDNIVVRFLPYLGETYHRYMEKNDLDVFSTKKVQLPKPELYVVFTGERKIKPATISLKKDIFGLDEEEDCCVEVEAKVIYGNEADRDILNQYIIFSKVFDEQKNLYPDDLRKAVQETIRICKDKDVLTAYLEQEEAAIVMYAFADQEREFKRALRKEGEAGEARGEARGEVKGVDKTTTLMDQLFSAGRMEDAQKAVKDKEYLSQLFREFNIN